MRGCKQILGAKLARSPHFKPGSCWILAAIVPALGLKAVESCLRSPVLRNPLVEAARPPSPSTPVIVASHFTNAIALKGHGWTVGHRLSVQYAALRHRMPFARMVQLLPTSQLRNHWRLNHSIFQAWRVLSTIEVPVLNKFQRMIQGVASCMGVLADLVHSKC